VTLDNLVGMSLETITPDPLTIRRLLDAAKRNLQDAKLNQLSNENRFDVAYKAIMQMANAALQSRGFRTLTSKPGHHQTMIQSLPKTLDVSHQQMIILDALRKQRNVADYSGDLVTDAAVTECIAQAESLWQIIETKTHLLKD
jgi:PBP1b-binding outer membrane lipoprotein LpoB